MPERIDPIWPVIAALMAAAVLGAMSLATGFGLLKISTTVGNSATVMIFLLVVGPLVALATFLSPRIAIAATFAAFFAGPEETRAAIFFFGILVILGRIAVGRTPIAWSPPLWWAAAFASWSFVLIGYAVEPNLATKEVVLLFAGVVFACIVLAACRTMDDARWIAGVFVLVGAAITARAFTDLSQLKTTFQGASVEGRLAGDFGSPNQLGSFCAMATFVAAGLALGGRTVITRIGAALAMAVLLLGLTFSLSRGAWIGSIAGFVFLLLSLRQARRIALAIGLPMILIAWALGSFAAENTQIKVITQRLGALTFTSPYDARPAIWDEALREIRTRPWTGYGPGSFPVSSLRAGAETRSTYALHAHNIFLNVGAESGLPALAMLLGLIGALALAGRRALRGARERGDFRDAAFIAGVLAALVSVLGQAFVDYTLRNVVIYVALWGLIGILLVARRTASGQTRRHDRHRRDPLFGSEQAVRRSRPSG